MPPTPASAATALDVFISHDHADIAVAGRVKRELKRSGLSVWLDVDEIREPMVLSDRILKALSQARHILVLWSRASARSAWVQMEWITIFNFNLLKKTVPKKGIIPCRLDNRIATSRRSTDTTRRTNT